LIGHRDDRPADRRRMRQAEAAIFAQLGWELPPPIDAVAAGRDGETP
jgi:hypothetical protein